MGKCYCDYCDVFLTNDSVAVRKQHNEGNRHKYNVCEYYRHYMGQQLQEQIDDIVRNFEEKVAKGHVRPTYGLPPGVKAIKEMEKGAPSAERDAEMPDPTKSLVPSSMPSSNNVADVHPQNPAPIPAVAIASSPMSTATPRLKI